MSLRLGKNEGLVEFFFTLTYIFAPFFYSKFL